MSSGSSGRKGGGILPTTQDTGSAGGGGGGGGGSTGASGTSSPVNPTPIVQRRSSQPLPGISATASSLRSRRAGSTSQGSSGHANIGNAAGSASNTRNGADTDDNDFDDETPGDFDPGMKPTTSRTARSNIPASLLRAALVPGNVASSNISQDSQSRSAANQAGFASKKPSAPLSPPPVPSNRFKGTPARATRYSLPVRAEKPVRTTKTSGKHVVLPSESQLAPLPGEEEEDDEDDDEDDDDDGSEDEEEITDEEEDEAAQAGASAVAGKAAATVAPKPDQAVQPVLLGGRGALDAVGGPVAKPPAKVPVTTPRAGPTISTNRHKAPTPVPGKLVTPVTKGSQRPAASSALARAAVSSISASQASQAHKSKVKPSSAFRGAATRAPPLRPPKSGPVYHTFERMPPSARLMTPLPRLTAYSISTSIHLGTLLGFLRREHGVKPRLYDECAYAVYTKPLLPGFGRANVRSAPEPRSASPGAESRRERELEQREEFGYLGTYFEHRAEEDEDIDQDGYIKGGEGRGSDSEARRGESRRGGDDGRGGGETSAWESEAERWTSTERRNSGPQADSATGNNSGATNLDSGSHSTSGEGLGLVGADGRQHDGNGSDTAVSSSNKDAISSSLDDDEGMLATPLARPMQAHRDVSDDEAGAALGERRPFLLERRRTGSQSSMSDNEMGRSPTTFRRTGSTSSEVRITAENETANALDSAGARDMMLQQRAEERGETEPVARSYQSHELSLVSDVEDAGDSSRDHTSSAAALDNARMQSELQEISETAVLDDPTNTSDSGRNDGTSGGTLVQSPTEVVEAGDGGGEGAAIVAASGGSGNPTGHQLDGEAMGKAGSAMTPSGSAERRTKKVKLRRRKRRYAGPNMASHNHDTSANLNTPRPILEALHSAELVILPYGVLVMYNFSAAEERSIIEDVLSSGCAREPIAEEARETEAFHFCYDPNISAPRIFNDFFTFRAPNHLLKLSLAHAIAQSTKLSVFEERMQATLELTSHIPKEMASTGELKLKRREALRLTGRLFKLRVDVNLTSNVLDTPELFWSEASLKLLYDAIRDYLEIDERVENLNERLAVANDLLEIIHEHIANTAMSKITWIVIILIVVACAVAVGEISARFIVGANRSAEEKAGVALLRAVRAASANSGLLDPATSYARQPSDLLLSQQARFLALPNSL
ncbi:DUF155-domain-containing protein [Testicularia cyperi]|uniref:DUF155-domain-containing protein n=1 Tax=Testicularia cyperi TaxID=1882483 RepID=A0A317XTI2_9BASI|nr:DUF155-domain-containing protein [Testicularia cyperi]